VTEGNGNFAVVAFFVAAKRKQKKATTTLSSPFSLQQKKKKKVREGAYLQALILGPASSSCLGHVSSALERCCGSRSNHS